MIYTILSRFDSMHGPKIFLRLPKSPNPCHLEHVPLLMDLYTEGFFVHEMGPLKTANHIFEISSPVARGRKEMVMLSIVSFNEEYNMHMGSFREIIDFFVDRLGDVDDLYKGFYDDSASGKFKQISVLFSGFHQAYLKQLRQERSKILSYGLSQSGRENVKDLLKQNNIAPKTSLY